MDIKYITSNNLHSSIKLYEQLYIVYKKVSDDFLKIRQNSLCNTVIKYLKKPISSRKIEHLEEIRNILETKIDKKTNASDYYKGILGMLIGKFRINNKDIMDKTLFLNLNSEQMDLIINTISFLEIFKENMNDNFEQKYQCMIIYCTYNSICANYTKEILEKENRNGIKSAIIRLISCINAENSIVYE